MQIFNKIKSKRKLLIIGSVIVVLLLAGALYLIFKPKKTTGFEELLKRNLPVEKVYKTDDYSLKVKKIDDYSFDRILEVYHNDEKIEFESIEYTDGIVVCSGEKPVIYYGNISKEKELIVVLKNKDRIKIKIGE